jgi:hypothetical protein
VLRDSEMSGAVVNAADQAEVDQIEVDQAALNRASMFATQFDPVMVAKSKRLEDAISCIDNRRVMEEMAAGADPSIPFAVSNGAFQTPWTVAIGRNSDWLFPILLGTDNSRPPLAISGHSPRLLCDVIVEQGRVERIAMQMDQMLKWIGDAPWRREALWPIAERFLAKKDNEKMVPAFWHAAYFSILGAGGIPSSEKEILDFLSKDDFPKYEHRRRFSRIELILRSEYAEKILHNFFEVGFSPNAILDGKLMIYHAAKANSVAPLIALIDAGATVSKDVAALCSTLLLTPEISKLIHARAAKCAIDEVLKNVRNRTPCLGAHNA